MGYTTEFKGRFYLDKPLDDNTFNLLEGLAKTRRMKRNIKGYGIEGEFYFNPDDFENSGQAEDKTIIDYNSPPPTQPSLWLRWIPTEDRQHIEWDGGEKFDGYVEWIEYIIKKILKPRGYFLNGRVEWCGEEGDVGTILAIDNKVKVIEEGFDELKELVAEKLDKIKNEKSKN
ncbi:hypothetical protein LCGC14_2532870 [marine sediment metagenome]|uniref:Uncharacterized protein n=1 Tax=marine sediment metagenome TaxID=412755 RepID=A0A0F9BFZ4_9ZZZZ